MSGVLSGMLNRSRAYIYWFHSLAAPCHFSELLRGPDLPQVAPVSIYSLQLSQGRDGLYSQCGSVSLQFTENETESELQTGAASTPGLSTTEAWLAFLTRPPDGNAAAEDQDMKHKTEMPVEMLTQERPEVGQGTTNQEDTI